MSDISEDVESSGSKQTNRLLILAVLAVVILLIQLPNLLIRNLSSCTGCIGSGSSLWISTFSTRIRLSAGIFVWANFRDMVLPAEDLAASYYNAYRIQFFYGSQRMS